MMRRSLALVGSVLVLLGLVGPGTAATSLFISTDVITLATNVSRAMVPAGAAETAVLIEADDEAALAAASLLGGLPLHVPLLLTEPGELSDGVLEELDRATGRGAAATVLLVGQAVRARFALAAAGYSVLVFDGTNPTALSAFAASEVYGAPAGTSQRVIIVPAGDEVVAGLASVLGIWLGIPVIPVSSSGLATDAFIREVWAVGFDGAPPAVSSPGPGTVRTFAAGNVFDLALELDELAAQELGDTSPQVGVTIAPIVVSVTGDTTPALVAATVAARRSLDGDRAPLVLIDGPFEHDFAGRCATSAADADNWCVLAAADGEVTFIGLSMFAPDGQVDDDPLPTTGAGLAIAGLVALVGALAGRRRD